MSDPRGFMRLSLSGEEEQSYLLGHSFLEHSHEAFFLFLFNRKVGYLLVFFVVFLI
jgi:hypothetical protein